MTEISHYNAELETTEAGHRVGFEAGEYIDPEVEVTPVGITDEDMIAAIASPKGRERMMSVAGKVLDNSHDAEDAVQDALVKAWRSKEGFKGRATVQTWLHRVAYNAASSEAGKRRKRNEIVSDIAVLVTAHSQDRFDAPEEFIVDAIFLDEVVRFMDVSANPGRFEALLLYAQGFTHSQIAKQLGITETASKVRVTRAKSDLRERFAHTIEMENAA